METYKNMPVEKLREKLSAVKKEHFELNEKVDQMAKKDFITPEEEVELKRLRKVKLLKKDMIAYLSTMVTRS